MNNFLPSGWEEVELVQVLETLESGSRPKGGVHGIKHGIPSLGGEHLNYDGSFNFINVKYIPETFAENMVSGCVEPNDILIVKDGATTGKIGFIDVDFPYSKAYVNEHLFLCKVSSIVNAKFLFHFLRSEKGQMRILKNFTGNSQGGINRSFAQNTIVPIAPFNEQRRIVTIIEERMHQVEQSRQQLQKLKAELHQYTEDIVTSAILGQLTEEWRNNNDYKTVELGDTQIEIPTDWIVEEFGNFVEEMKNGLSKKPANSPPGIPILRISSVRPSAIDLHDHKYLNSSEVPSSFLLEESDLLFTRYNGSLDLLGVCGIVKGLNQQQVTYPDKLIRVRTRYGILLPEFTQLFFLSKHARGLILAIVKSGAGLNGISGKSLQEVQFILPPVEEQQEIVRLVNEQMQVINMLETNYNSAINEVESLPQIILAKAFAGELTEQDPDDESASILLKRILKEREAVANKQKAKKIKTELKKKMAEIKLLETIQQTFPDQSFTFDDLRNNTTKGYETLRDELYRLIEVDKKIIHQFDPISEMLTFSLAADANPTN